VRSRLRSPERSTRGLGHPRTGTLPEEPETVALGGKQTWPLEEIEGDIVALEADIVRVLAEVTGRSSPTLSR